MFPMDDRKNITQMFMCEQYYSANILSVNRLLIFPMKNKEKYHQMFMVE